MREPSLASLPRIGHALLGTACLLFAGCFGPQIASGAFGCDPQDDPPCPNGFFCVDERCVSVSDSAGDGGAHGSDGAAGAVDAAGAAEDLSVAPGGDLLQAPFDLTARPDLRPPPDLSPPLDLATGMCGHAGAPCTSIGDCCSMYCRTDGICIGG
jgi:hypothetical protein